MPKISIINSRSGESTTIMGQQTGDKLNLWQMVKGRLALWTSSRLTANRLLPLAPLKAIFLSKRANKILIINISQKIGIEWSNFAPKNLSFNRLVDLHFFAGIK